MNKTTVQLVVTDPETGRTTVEIVKANTIDELNTKVKAAYSRCLIEIKEQK